MRSRIELWFVICAATVTFTTAQAVEENDRASDDHDQTTIQRSDELTLHSQSTAAVCFARDGLLATTSLDQTVKLWDGKRRRVVASLQGFPPSPEGTWDRDVAFSPDGRLLAVVTTGTAIQVWQTETKRELWCADSGARSLAFSPNSKTIVTADWEDASIKVWDAGSGELLKTLAGTTATIQPGCWSQGTVAFAPDGKSFVTAVGGADQKGVQIPTLLTIWNADTLTADAQFVPQSSRVHAMAYSPDGKNLAIGGVGGTIRLLEFPEQKKDKAAAEEIKQAIAQLDDDDFQQREDAQRKLLAIGSAARAELEKVARATDSAEVRFRIRQILAAVASDGRVKVSKVFEQSHEGTIMGISYSPDGKLLATCSRTYREGRGRVVVWLVEDTKRPLFVWNGPGVTSIQFSPDGTQMASSGEDGKVTIWQISREIPKTAK